MAPTKELRSIKQAVWVAAPMVAALAYLSIVDHAQVWIAWIASAIGVGLLMLLQGNGGSGPSLVGTLFKLAVEKDFEALERHAKNADAFTPELAQYIEELKSHGSDGADIERLKNAIGRIALNSNGLTESLRQEAAAIAQVSSAADATLATQNNTAHGIDELSRSAEESSSSILEMVAINNEVRENVGSLAASVDETTTAIEEMTFSSKEVAKNIEELSTAAEETAASMNEMDVSINQVETNATETSRLSEQVTKDAETGVGAINHTIRGIDTIKESSRVAADVITSLGQKIDQIGNILNVIDDVAEQTNLLALNAAIIAAQAGEHGRGFAVVADEIKALAERTGASTKEIAGLIQTIQEQSRQAVTVMSKGVEDVEEGVRLGHNAEDALRKIVESAKRSTLMIQAIAQATVEQAKGSKQVTNAISRIAETVQQIAFATAEQAKGAEHIMTSAERMKVITQQVERSADEQNRGGEQVTRAIENIREQAERITKAVRDHEDAGRGLSAAIDECEGANRLCVESGAGLETMLGEVAAELEAVNG